MAYFHSNYLLKFVFAGMEELALEELEYIRECLDKGERNREILDKFEAILKKFMNDRKLKEIE